jgi:hypothetical protein
MRNTLAVALGIAVLYAPSAMAGDYHYKTTLNCPDCHVMHSSQQHGYNADSAGSGVFVVTTLCLSCHNNQTFAPDVLGANGGTAFTNGRQAGALNMDNTAPYFDVAGHTLGSVDVAPGGTWKDSTGLNCTDCHTVHGNAYYRNTRSRGVASASRHYITYATGTNDLTKSVFQGSASLANHYSVNNIYFNEPSQDSSQYGAFCMDCHTVFHGNEASSNMYNSADSSWVRHPTSGVNMSTSMLTRYTARPYRVKVMSSTGAWGTDGAAWVGAPTDLTPSCFSCHKGHGNKNAFGLIFATGAGVIEEEGDAAGAATRQLCQQCHSQGT